MEHEIPDREHLYRDFLKSRQFFFVSFVKPVDKRALYG